MSDKKEDVTEASAPVKRALPPRPIPYRSMGPVARAIGETNAAMGRVKSDKRILRANWWLYKAPADTETEADVIAFFGKPPETPTVIGQTSTGHTLIAVWNGPAGIPVPGRDPDGDPDFIPEFC